MDTGSSLHLSSEELTRISSPLLKAALEHIPVYMLILKPVWQNDQITDFILVYAKTPDNHTTTHLAVGKKLHTQNRQLVNTLIHTVEEGTTNYLNDTYIFNEQEQLKVTCIKLRDAVLVLYAPDIVYQQEEQIRTSRDILRESEALVDMGSWEYNTQTGHFKWSEGMFRLFNLPKNTPVTPAIYFDYTPEEEKKLVTWIVDNITRNFRSFEETITLLPRNREKKNIKIRATVMYDAKKNPVKIIGVDLDITAQVKAAKVIDDLNQTLQRKNSDLRELNAELRAFNTITARDYKETIQVLYTSLEYIITKEARILSNNSKGNIRRAQSAIQKMKLLTDDINTYLQLYDFGINKSIIDPNRILDTVISGLRVKIEQANAQVDTMTLPLLPADPYLFSRLMTHLLDNALKFRKLIAPLQIKIKYSKADEMNSVPSALRDTSYIIISVSDNGIGFEDEDADKIFEPFLRLHIKAKYKYKGSGIGLAVCRKIMTMHDGFITAEGSPAHGATINCYFPLPKGEE